MSTITGENGKVAVVLGAQWGDEGKGKLVDILAEKYDIIARFNGGANAGHTLVVDGRKFAFHLLPCGILYSGKVNVIGNGVVLHVPTMMDELKALEEAGIDWSGRLAISNRAHILLDAHMIVDGRQETALAANNIGTTRKGIGPCYSTKAQRNGLRVGDLADFDNFSTRFRQLINDLGERRPFDYDVEAELNKYREYAKILKPMICDSAFFINQQLNEGKRILCEGANAALLDLDHGTYPFVTSSSTTIGGVSTGLGLPPRHFSSVIGVVKAYTTRVGSGPFPTELHDSNGEKLRAVGKEFGTTTGRPRRCGWLDIPVIKYSHLLNGYDSINITKLDVLTGINTIRIGIAYTINGKRLPDRYMPSTLIELSQVQVEYEDVPGWNEDISRCKTVNDLPINAKNYIKRITELSGIPVSWIGVGPGRLDMARG